MGKQYFKAGQGPFGTGGGGGSDGNWIIGAGSPAADLGLENDHYFNYQNGDNFIKRSGSWYLFFTNAYFLQGFNITQVQPDHGQLLIFDNRLFPPAGGWTPGGIVTSGMPNSEIVFDEYGDIVYAT